jgi:predicted dienelactone hydrolase
MALRLVDRSRPDPLRGPGFHRELMAGVWYPAQDAGRHPRARWIAPGALTALLISGGFAADAASAPVTAGHQDAAVLRDAGRLPVVLFSHGAHDHRADTTVIVQELASHGYGVVTVDHTNDAFTEFPGGRVSVPSEDPRYTMGPQDFADDILFVLDHLDDLGPGLRGVFDLARVGMFGWSKGGSPTGGSGPGSASTARCSPRPPAPSTGRS